MGHPRNCSLTSLPYQSIGGRRIAYGWFEGDWRKLYCLNPRVMFKYKGTVSDTAIIDQFWRVWAREIDWDLDCVRDC